MKTEKQIFCEMHDELLRKKCELRLELDKSHLREPLKKQDKLCAELLNLEEDIALLEKRME